jgi:hypothetical protein
MLKENYDPDQYKFNIQKKLDEMKHSDILPKYPADRSPHVGDTKIRKRKPILVKKIVFDLK